ncbi:MAG: hypothetical protein ACLFV6_10225 [Spirulinaceae cyanobacterium]
MFKMGVTHSSRVIQLAENIKVDTDIRDCHLPALRSGFAGYPANPRWDGSKFMTWKMGRQWRNALQMGTVVIRQSDSMLVLADDEQNTDKSTTKTDKMPSKSFLSRFDLRNQFVRFYAPQSTT